VRLEWVVKLDGSSFPVRPTFNDEVGKVCCSVMDAEAGAVKRQHIEELVLRAPDLQ
jgi:hypothetical protein